MEYERKKFEMSPIDWLIVFVPVAFVIYMGYYSMRYIRGVADFLSAGRVAGRYVISVADVANGLAVITVVAYVEVHYKTGFAMAFWNSIVTPLSVILALTGFCTYRFRETRAMSLGQFLEMRYNKAFRLFASALRSISEMLANMIAPAIAARFFIYFFDLPTTVSMFGVKISTFMIVTCIVLVLAISIVCMGGTLALIITDTIQGLMCYPMLVIFTVFILVHFSWSREIIPVMSDRVAGESFLNPYDVSQLRDFNIFALVVTVASGVLNRASWIGAGNTTAAKTPHEQKMASVLGTWRNGFSSIFYVLIAIMIITLLNHRNFAVQARDVRLEIADKVAEELIPDADSRRALKSSLGKIEPVRHRIGVDQPLSQEKNLDTVYFDAALKTIRSENMARADRESTGLSAELRREAREQAVSEANSSFQQFRTLFNQLMLPVSMRHMLPMGLMGMFCLLMVIMMVSTDDTRIFCSSLTITQDCILPLLKKPLDPKQHILLLRLISIGVGIFFFCGSFFMAQLDYINLFVTIICSMWLGGAGPVMIFGLYSRFGTACGAFCSLLTGMSVSLGGILIQRNWADSVYPWLLRNGLVESAGNFLSSVSAPLDPIVTWKMDSIKCPVNANEFFFMAMMLSLAAYCIGSALTCRKPFNLERMLHRGKYRVDGEKALEEPISIRAKLYRFFIGITNEYSTGDKVIAWSVFLYSFIWGFCLVFLGTVAWNFWHPWPLEYWAFFFLANLILSGVIATISTVWFTIGGIIDIRALFRDLRTRTENPLDDGRVENNMSLSDKAILEKIDPGSPQDAAAGRKPSG